MIRKATSSDLIQIESIYNAIHREKEEGRVFLDWTRDVYPTRETAKQVMDQGELFVKTRQNRIVATCVLTHEQLEQYRRCHWKYPAQDHEVLVLRTLAVDPNESGTGCGKAMVGFYEDYARKKGCKVLRLDTNPQNEVARGLYKKQGFREAGIVTGEFKGVADVRCLCLEKLLQG